VIGRPDGLFRVRIPCSPAAVEGTPEAVASAPEAAEDAPEAVEDVPEAVEDVPEAVGRPLEAAKSAPAEAGHPPGQSAILLDAPPGRLYIGRMIQGLHP
jgi:hypothetical protein